MSVLPFKKVLLSGGTGYLGSHLIPMLLKENCELILLVRSQSRTEHLSRYKKAIQFISLEGVDLHRLLVECKVDAVLHAACAGRNGGKQTEIEAVNVELGKRLLQNAIEAKCTHFLHTDTALFGAQDFYVQTKKRFREELLRAGHRIRACNFLIQPIYGAGGRGFLNSLIEKMVSKSGEPIPLPIPLTDGKQIRDVIYIEDCISALRTLLLHLPKANGFVEFGVGTGVGYRLKEMVEVAAKLIGNPQLKLDYGALAPRASEPTSLVANIDTLTALGWRSEVSLQEGLRRLVESYRDLAESDLPAAAA